MANTELTKGNGGHSQRPVDVLRAMRSEMDRLFERFEHGFPRWPSVFGRAAEHDLMMPELDVHDNSNQLTIDVDLPGVDEKDVSVTLANGILTIKGEKKSEREEKKENYYMADCRQGCQGRCQEQGRDADRRSRVAISANQYSQEHRAR